MKWRMNWRLLPMTERELRAAAFGIITYCSICQTGEPPALNSEAQIVEASAFLDDAILETTIEICAAADLDGLELLEAEPV